MNTKKLLIYFICLITYPTIFASDKSKYIHWRGDSQSFSFKPSEIIHAYTDQLYGCNALFIGKKDNSGNINAHMSHYRSDIVPKQAHEAFNFIQLYNIDPNDQNTAIILFRMKNNDPQADLEAKSKYIGTPEEAEHANNLAFMNEQRDIKNQRVLNTIKSILNCRRDPKIVEYSKITEFEDPALGAIDL